jgi:hypothetical protein
MPNRFKCYETEVHWKKTQFENFIEGIAIDLIQYVTKIEGERTKLLTKLLYSQIHSPLNKSGTCYERHYCQFYKEVGRRTTT